MHISLPVATTFQDSHSWPSSVRPPPPPPPTCVCYSATCMLHAPVSPFACGLTMGRRHAARSVQASHWCGEAYIPICTGSFGAVLTPPFLFKLLANQTFVVLHTGVHCRVPACADSLVHHVYFRVGLETSDLPAEVSRRSQVAPGRYPTPALCKQRDISKRLREQHLALFGQRCCLCALRRHEQ